MGRQLPLLPQWRCSHYGAVAALGDMDSNGATVQLTLSLQPETLLPG